MRVLVVEDNVLIAMDTEQSIVDAGHESAGLAASRRSALALATRADAALVDVNLADGATGVQTGLALARDHGLLVAFVTSDIAALGTGVPGTFGALPKPALPREVANLLGCMAAYRIGQGGIMPLPRRFVSFAAEPALGSRVA
ncbi:response regulator [Pararhizobium mangrovi]|nr:response regulator [Pararhizobium mangrovi]